MSEFGKQYSSDEEFLQRYEIFQKKLREIEEHPAEELGYWLRLNHMSDETDEEKSVRSKPFIEEDHPMVGAISGKFVKKSTSNLPSGKDWRSKQTPVKFQGAC